MGGLSDKEGPLGGDEEARPGKDWRDAAAVKKRKAGPHTSREDPAGDGAKRYSPEPTSGLAELIWPE